MLAAQSRTGIRHSALANKDRTLPGGLGRFAAKDPRDQNHTFGALLKRRAGKPTSKTWRTSRPALDQGQTSRCVAFSWTQFLGAQPIQTRAKVRTEDALNELYHQAQVLDEWPGEDYNGTSVRGGAKALQAAGHLSEYVWGTTLDDLRAFVSQRGPVVIGSDWYEEMFYPEKHDGYLVPEGANAGGHAWLIYGYDAKKDEFRMLNSWGPNWGVKGTAKIRAADMQKLLDTNAEMCSAIECRVPRKKATA